MKRLFFVSLGVIIAFFAVITACENAGSGATTGAPRLVLYNVTVPGSKTVVNNGDTIDFGLVHEYASQGATTSTRNFEIDNEGDADLNLTGSSAVVVISGTDAANFTVPSQPPGTLPAGGSATFVAIFTASRPWNSKAATCTIESDDPELGAIAIYLTGDVTC